ncbi:MAG: ABC transporter substrate-binding protein [Deltaproteobacteria bacterium]|nr:MAG: ABC transporter substrate-binding protein [Deltaproteobacteria bacterium]TMB32640.1 MAG: ABC transporter substrate-binding protein [Deltaproteobacteria bacterium]
MLRFTAFLLLVASGAVAAEATEIRIAEQYGLAFLPLMIMRDQRIIERRGAQLGVAKLDVKWAKIGAVNAINDALLAGELDFAAGGVPSLVLLWAKTRNTAGAVRGVAALGDIPNELIVSRREVKSIRDLGPSDKIAVTAVKISNQAIALQMAAAQEFGPDNYEKLDPLTVGMAHPDAAVALLSGSGGITGHFSAPPFLERELRAKGLHSILSTYDVLGGPATLNVIWTRAAFREGHPKAYQAFVSALEEAMEVLNRDKRAAAAVYKRLTNSSESVEEIAGILEDPRFVFTVTPHRVMRTAEFMHRTARVKERPASWKDLFFPEAHRFSGN